MRARMHTRVHTFARQLKPQTLDLWEMPVAASFHKPTTSAVMAAVAAGCCEWFPGPCGVHAWALGRRPKTRTRGGKRMLQYNTGNRGNMFGAIHASTKKGQRSTCLRAQGNANLVRLHGIGIPLRHCSTKFLCFPKRTSKLQVIIFDQLTAYRSRRSSDLVVSVLKSSKIIL